MKGIKLTKLQEKVLEAIRRHVKRRGMPPSRSEIGKATGISNQSGVERVLDALAKKGWLKLMPGIDRGIRLLREGAPVIGPEELPRMAAGTPATPWEPPEPERLHDFDTFAACFESAPDYFLKVNEGGMDLTRFRPGDLLAVRKGESPRDGDIVVAKTPQETALKRHRRRGDRAAVTLEPVDSASCDGKIRVLGQGDLEISAIVVGAIIGPGREQPGNDKAKG